MKKILLSILLHSCCLIALAQIGTGKSWTADNGAPYSADKTGCNPNRRDGTVFQWTVVESDGVARKTESSSTY